MPFKSDRQRRAVMAKLRLETPDISARILSRNIEFERGLIPNAEAGFEQYGSTKQIRNSVRRKELVLKSIKGSLTRPQVRIVKEAFIVGRSSRGVISLFTKRGQKIISQEKQIDKFLSR